MPIKVFRLFSIYLSIINSNIVKLINLDYKEEPSNESTKIQDLKVIIRNFNIIIQEFNIIITRLRALRDLYCINYKDLIIKNRELKAKI